MKNSNVLHTIEQLETSFDKVSEEDRGKLTTSLASLLRRISDDLLALGDVPSYYLSEYEPMILKQLQAADKRTENAANEYMDIAEEISKEARSLEPPAKDKMQKLVYKIYENSNFQDLVSQHLNEIRLLLETTNKDISELKSILDGLGIDPKSDAAKKRRQTQIKRPDDHLLNGPALDFLEDN